MKKIKGILLFGILTLLGIGSSFSTNNSLSVFHIYNQSNALLMSTHSSKRSGVFLANRLSTYFYGGQQNPNYWHSFGNFTSFSSLSTSSRYFPFGLSINNGTGFYLSGSYLNGSGNWVDFSLVNNSFSQELGNYSINYNSGEDFYPLVFDEYYNYFTLTDNEIIYNGTPYGSFNFGTLEYCLYGINWDFSCVYTTTTGINFVHFNYNTSDEYGYFFSGYLLQPLNILTSNNDFTGTGTLIISLDSQDRVIYNIIDVYSDNPVILSAGNIIDKGFIDIGSVLFSHRYFLGNNVFGNFSEIYNLNGNYYFRSNIINSYTTNTSSNRSYCDLYPSTCFSSTGLSLISDSSVSDIPLLGNGGNGNQSTYSGSVSLNNCIDTQVCYDTTGDNGEILRICTTKCIDSGSISSGSYIGSDGTIYYVDSSVDVGNISNPDGTIYDTGFLDEDGMLSIDYYSGLFNGNGFRFGVCPYPPSDYLNFATKVNLGNFYPFMPLNCFVSAFQQGVKVHYFDDNGLFPDNHSQLMAGDSHYHRTLFRFFDVLLSIGILLLLSALLRIIKK